MYEPTERERLIEAALEDARNHEVELYMQIEELQNQCDALTIERDALREEVTRAEEARRPHPSAEGRAWMAKELIEVLRGRRQAWYSWDQVCAETRDWDDDTRLELLGELVRARRIVRHPDGGRWRSR